MTDRPPGPGSLGLEPAADDLRLELVRRDLDLDVRHMTRVHSLMPLASPAGMSPARALGMPFKSKAQRRKFAQLLVEGKIKDETFEEWNRSTGKKVLPERIHPKTDGDSRKKAVKRSSRAKPKA